MLQGGKEGGATALREAPAADAVRVLMPSPIGRLGIEFRGQAVTRLVVQPSAAQAKQYQSLHDVELTDFLTEAIGRLSEYFAGVRADPAIAVDLSQSELDEFGQRVLAEVSRIPYGKTWTYKKLAEAIGRREAHPQVRRVLASNPIPVLIPCHRVVPERGGAGAWIGGSRKKEKLLRVERRGKGAA